ncbi:hypothetical protein MKW92_048490 [Papaver armeniacum]|nr:hypothetical protein MKW92_048490 [Papaver armeniacum]
MNIPWDILLDILIRLPLKSIVRFRCVNQSWYSKLKCPKFLKARIDYAVEMGKFNLMIHHHNDMYTFNYNSSLSTCEESNHIEYPVESAMFGIGVLGCCNGLVLLKHVNKFNFYVLILWNPTTNECKRIPSPLIEPKRVRRQRYVEYGFGYDEQIEDFKVVHLREALHDGWCEVQVYTLKENSWRRIDSVEIDGLYYPKMSDMGRWPVNGGFHWIVQVERSDFLDGFFLLRFEFETEEFNAVPLLPDFDVDARINLCVLRGSLCCFCCNTEVIRVRELKDSEEEESWTKLFTIEVRKHFGAVASFMPLHFLNNGKIVLGLQLSDGCLHIVLCDPKHVTFETIKVHDAGCPESTSVYVESLFSLGTGTYLGKVQWEASHEEEWNDSTGEDDDDMNIGGGGGDGEEE